MKKPWFVVESELDGWLIHEKAGDLLKVFAIGNASSRPDIKTHEYLQKTPGLLCLDNDEAGQNEQTWWKNQYPNMLTWYSQFGKDPGEDFQAGNNIREWIKDGLKNLEKITGSKIIDQVGAPKKDTNFIDQVHVPKETEIYQRTLAATQNKTSQKLSTRPKKDPPKFSNKICRHNIYCASLKDGICLKNNQPVFAGQGMNRCPKEQWWVYQSENSVISEIILGPGVKR